MQKLHPTGCKQKFLGKKKGSSFVLYFAIKFILNYRNLWPRGVGPRWFKVPSYCP